MTDKEILEQALAMQESMRGKIADEILNAAIEAIQKQIADLEPTPPIEQRKQITILYAAISNFELIAEQIDVEEVGQVINTCFEVFTPTITKFGGVVEQFTGDAILAVFGLPQARENDPENGIKAALEMRQELDQLNTQISAKWNFQLGMQIGISTGMVIARNFSGTQDRDFSVVGSTVNLTKQLEKAAPVGGILISHDSYRHVRGVFDVQEHELLQILGRTRPVRTYLVQRAKPRAFRIPTWSVAGIETRMVGREAELMMLQNLFHDATEDARGHIVTIMGEAGLGKSRLLYEFDKWIELLPDDVWYFKGRAMSATEIVPYGLMRSIFAHRFDILESDSVDEVREKFRSGMAVALESDQADLVGQLLGFDFSTSQAVRVQLGHESFSELATSHLTHYLQVMAKEPTVIFLEDVHWADDSSLDLIDHLVLVSPTVRLLVVCLARPALLERRPSWGEGRENHTKIPLKRLSRRASRTLVSEILQRAPAIPIELRDLIVNGAEGNPFYVEELIKVLIEDGVIVKSEQQWRIEMERLAAVRVPPTLTGVIQARLDSLPPLEKMLLQRAAVIGRQFWAAAVVELANKEIDNNLVYQLLGNLRKRELILRRERSAFVGADEYIFKHTLLRDVAYQMVLLKLRRVYHEQVARWLEDAAGNRIGEYLGVIASHYDLAGEKEKAVEYLLLAGDQARLAYACQEARGYYERALPLLEEQGFQDQAARTLMKLGLTYDLSFNFQRSREAYEKGFALWQQAGIMNAQDLAPAPIPLKLAADNPTTLDPTMAEDSRSSTIIFELFSGLVEQRLDMEVVPDIAHSWEVHEGGKRFIFHLRRDVFWSDGIPVSAGDFECAWKRVLSPASGMPLASLLDDIKGASAFRQGQESDPRSVGVNALDETTLAVDLEGPTGYFLHLLANTITFPVPRHVLTKQGDDWAIPENIVTCGPFHLEVWHPGEQMILVRNPHYPGRISGNAERIDLFLRKMDPINSLGMYENNRLDVVDVTKFDAEHVRQKYAGELFIFPQLMTAYLQFDVSRPPFDDVRVRRAFVLATNRENLVRTARPDCYPAKGGFVPPGMPGHMRDIGRPHDIAQARQYLADAGYSEGKGFPLIECIARPDQADLGENLQIQWRENLGIEINWKTIEWQSILARLGQQMPHLLIMGWVADYPDPDNFLRARLDHIQLQSGWRNERYDTLVKQAQRSLDQRQRMQLYDQAERILVEEAPIMPIFHRSIRLLVKPWITRFPTTGLREWFLKDVIIKPN